MKNQNGLGVSFFYIFTIVGLIILSGYKLREKIDKDTIWAINKYYLFQPAQVSVEPLRYTIWHIVLYLFAPFIYLAQFIYLDYIITLVYIDVMLVLDYFLIHPCLFVLHKLSLLMIPLQVLYTVPFEGVVLRKIFPQ